MKQTAFLLLAALAPLASANTTYSYTGSPFNSYAATFTSANETEITASFTVAAPFGDSVTVNFIPLSFSISDGFATLTNLSPNIQYGGLTVFSFQTDASGNILYWDMNVVQTTGGTTWRRLLTEDGADNSITCGNGAVGNECSPTNGSATILYSSGQPVWTESSSVPEPSTSALIGIALAAVSFRMRRRPPA